MSPAVVEAARWLVDHDAPRPIIPTLRRQFRLSATEAVDALREANRQRDALSKELSK